MLCGCQTEFAERRTNKGSIRIVSQVRRTEGIHDSITSRSATLQQFSKKKQPGAPRSRDFPKRNNQECHALEIFQKETTRSVTLQRFFKKKHPGVPRSSNFPKRNTQKRHALEIFQKETTRSATLQQFSKKKYPGSATLQRFFKKKHTGAPRSRTSQKRKYDKDDKKRTGDTKKKTQRQKNSKPRREENPGKYKIQETRLYMFKKTCILQDRHMQVLFLTASFIFVFISTFTPVFEESQRAQNEIKRYSREFYS